MGVALSHARKLQICQCMESSRGLRDMNINMNINMNMNVLCYTNGHQIHLFWCSSINDLHKSRSMGWVMYLTALEMAFLTPTCLVFSI